MLKTPKKGTHILGAGLSSKWLLKDKTRAHHTARFAPTSMSPCWETEPHDQTWGVPQPDAKGMVCSTKDDQDKTQRVSYTNVSMYWYVSEQGRPTGDSVGIHPTKGALEKTLRKRTRNNMQLRLEFVKLGVNPSSGAICHK